MFGLLLISWENSPIEADQMFKTFGYFIYKLVMR